MPTDGAGTGAARGGPLPGVRDLTELLSALAPSVAPTEAVFARLPTDAAVPADLRPDAVVHEDEGTTVVLDRPAAEALGWAFDGGAFRRITLGVHSALDAVGLTAAVSGALAAAGIPANIIAGYFHDHVYVPADRCEQALAVLRDLDSPA